MDINNIQPGQSGDNGSGNTAIIVIVIIAAVAFGIWWFSGRGNRAMNTNDNNPGLNIDVNLPGTTNGGSGTTSGSGTTGGSAGGTTTGSGSTSSTQ